MRHWVKGDIYKPLSFFGPWSFERTQDSPSRVIQTCGGECRDNTIVCPGLVQIPHDPDRRIGEDAISTMLLPQLVAD